MAKLRDELTLTSYHKVPEVILSQSFLRVYRILCVSVFGLILLGGSVRAMNAGLACPDWPLCFGDIIPDYHPQVYFEFMHRVLAGLVSLAILALNGRLILAKNIGREVKLMCWGSFLLLGAQVVLGGLTVLLALKAEVVTWHLAMGTGLLLNLAWIGFSIHPQGAVKNSKKALFPLTNILAIFFFLVIYGQVLLGGVVAANYAALACTGFPLCNGEWVPTLSGVVGIHVFHRFGAYFTFMTGLVGYFLTLKNVARGTEFRKRMTQAFYLILVQIGFGVASFFLGIPPLMTVIHLGLGALLLVLSLRMVFVSRLEKESGKVLK